MDVNDLRSLVTVISLLLFVCLVAWTWSRRRKAAFDEALTSPPLSPSTSPTRAIVLTFKYTIAAAMTTLWPISRPLIPAWMLIELAQNMTSKNTYA